MINLAVLNLKDIIKYLLKFLLIIIILWSFSKFFSPTKIKQTNLGISIDNNKFLECLDETIPGMKQLNDKEIVADIKNNNPLKTMLKLELSMLNNIKEKEIKNVTEENEELKVEQAKTGLQTEKIENNVPEKFTNSYNGVNIKNGTDYNLTEDILKPDIEINSKNIMIFHTHTCESYTATEKFNYTQTGTYRTTDLNYNVARVGTELTNQLKSYNYNVIHNTTYHDYPAYNGSYERSLSTVKNLLLTNENTDVIFDIHRDAIADYSYAPSVKIGEEYCAQLMFVIGTDGGRTRTPKLATKFEICSKSTGKSK